MHVEDSSPREMKAMDAQEIFQENYTNLRKLNSRVTNGIRRLERVLLTGRRVIFHETANCHASPV